MYVRTHVSQNKTSNIYISIWLATLAHILNKYDISLNAINYLIFNKEDFRDGLWSSMLDLFWSIGITTVYIVSAKTILQTII